jgi:steroid delta-isomerase-like uncharacterized protein
MPDPTDLENRLERLIDGVWNGEDPSVADELVAEDYYIHDRDLAEEIRGPELYRALASGTREVFPDMRITIEDSVAAGDRVALRWTMHGTHEGELFGVAPTGRAVTLSAIEIDRFEGGRLAETWTQSDTAGLMEQVGALPESAADRG